MPWVWGRCVACRVARRVAHGIAHGIARVAVAALIIALGITGVAPRAEAQLYFGQNLVQYDRLDWRVIETEHFLVHYYPVERTAAMDAARLAERSYGRLSRLLQHQFREKKPIIVFQSRGDFAQSNVFGDLGEGTGGVTDILRQRMAQPLTGDYRSFEHVLMHEMTHQFQYDIFARGKAGANIQQFAQVNPPLWFMEGMAEFLSLGYDHPQTDAWLRDAAVNGTLPSIKEMTDQPEKFFPYRYGFALWQYVGQRWGDEAIGEIMNAVPSLGVERAFRRELGMSLDDLSDEWHESVQDKFLPNIANLDRPRKFAQPLLTQRRTGGVADLYIAPTLSPDGKNIAFISYGSFLRGEVFPDLYLADAQTGRRIKRLVRSTTNTNTEELRQLYSQASFSPDGKLLAYVAQTKGKDVIYVLDVQKRETIRRFDLPVEGATSPAWSPDGTQLVFSGNVGGITDLYLVNADGAGFRQLTHDRNGDEQPQWSPDGRTIAFASDRDTDFGVLRLAKWKICLYDVASGQVTELPNQSGLNINPQWAPDGRSIAYVSDRTGTANLFLYDLDAREQYQLTNVLGAVNALTEYSPAITWARQADLLAFTYYEKGTNNVWSIKNPRLLKRAPFRDRPGAAAIAARDTVPNVVAERTDTSVAQRSVYRTPESGFRPSEQIAGSIVGANLTVTAMLDSAVLALPDTTRFKQYRYAAGFQPEYISQPQVGYGSNGFGQGAYGGTTIVLSDLLGNQQLAFSGAVNGRFSDAMIYASYANLARRAQYQTGISQQPYYLLGNRALTTDDKGNQAVADNYLRYMQRDVFATGLYPLDRFRRIEFGMHASAVSQSQITVTTSIDQAGFAVGQQFGKGTSLGTAFMVSPSVAYVSDNALYGYTAPIMGHRYRTQFSPSVGTWRWLDYLVDARRYDPILFDFLTVATRFTTSITAGRDETRFRKYIGRPEYVRGYDRQAYDTYFCSGDQAVGDASAQCGALQLFGSRVAFANAELRFPLVRRLDLGFLPIALPPVDGLFFYDAGLAWDGGMRVYGSRPVNYDLNTQRFPLRSYGFGIRFNLFGFAIIRWDYARPLDAASKKGFGTWSFGPSF